MEIQVEGTEEISAKLERLAANVRDLSPAFDAFAEYVETSTQANIGASRDFDGNAFAPLAAKTIEGRYHRRGANRRKKSGALTKRAAGIRAGIEARGGERPLLFKGKLIKGVRAKGRKLAFQFTAPGYLVISMVGTKDGRQPMRNPTPFLREGNRWVLHARAQERLNALVRGAVFR